MSPTTTAGGQAVRPARGTMQHADRLVGAIDIAGTSIKAALFEDSSEPLHEFRASTPRHLGPDAVVREVNDVAATASAALGRAVEAPEVVSAAAAGESWAVQIWHEAIQLLAQGLFAAILLSDPSRIIVGGGLSLAGPALLDPLRQELADLYLFGEPPPIDLARFGDTGALRGAAASARDLLGNTVGAR